ncbi:MAG: glutamyl-tRNA reductase [Myxococcota bacterium]
MKLTVIGLSHHTAPVSLRERFALRTGSSTSEASTATELEETLDALRGLEGVSEACVISTCNRVEYYVAGGDPSRMKRELQVYLQSMAGIPLSELSPHLYAHEGEGCLQHLFRVAGSLDSMVVGEPQILGQVKQAFQAAERRGAVGTKLGKAFQKSFAVAKRIRNETGIAENAVSMSFAAVELGREIFDDLSGKEVLLLGAGEMATLAAKHLMAHGVSRVRVASRTFATADKLAQEIGGQPSTLEDLPLLLSKVDIVICSTAAPGYVVDKRMMSQAVRDRRYRPILFVDIAVPRDVDPRVGEVDNCYVYDVDDLKAVLETNRELRRKEAEAAEELIRGELEEHVRWAKSQEVVPVIKALREKATIIARGEAERTLGHMRDADPKTAKSIAAMSNAIVNKLLHPVLTKLKAASRDGGAHDYVDALTELFDLETSAELEAKPAAETPTNVVSIDSRKAGGMS